MANVQLDAELVVRLKNFEKILNDIKKGLASVKLPEFKFSSQSAKDFTAFIRAVSQSGPQLQGAARNINTFAASIAGATAQLNKAAPGLKAMASALNAVNTSAKSAGQSTKFTTTMMEDLGRQTAITIRRFGGFLIARDLIFGITYGFRTAVVEAVKFEREMSKLAQLQNTTLEGTKELGRFIGELATKFGASSSKLAESAQVLGQAGKRTGEIKTILKALGEASLTPTFGDLTKTTDSLLAVLGQFNLKGKDAAETLDILNSVSKEFNVSVDELFEGVRRAGSTFAELSGVRAGVKPGIDALKEFAALFTAVIDTSRESAETIGTAFRTILPRLLRGETRELLKRELGLDLLDDEQKFIGPFKAIEKLFTGLRRFSGTDVGLTKIIEELGGSRQFNRVLPLILEFPKAQRALEIANQSSGSVAKDTAVAYDTLIVQLQQLKEQFLLLGRDLVDSGTFKALADGFVIAAKSAAVLIKALEPLLPLIGALAGASLAKGVFSFGKGFLLDNAFRMGPVRKASGGNINKVQSLLTPGELVLSPESARMNGQAALRRFNSTGDIGALKTLKGASMVPGTGNTDSVPANLEPGSFVIRKQSVQKALGFKKFAKGGRVGMAQGDFALSPSLGGLDASTTANLIKYGRELRFLGENTKNINNLFKSILSSSRDLPTALTRIATIVNRSYPATNPNLPGGGVNGGSLNIPTSAAVNQARYGFGPNFIPMQTLQQSANAIAAQTPRGVIPMGGPQSGPTIYAKTQGMIDFEDQLRSGQGVSAYSTTNTNNPYATRPSKYGNTLSDRAAIRLRGAYIQTARVLNTGVGGILDRGNDLVGEAGLRAGRAVRSGGAVVGGAFASGGRALINQGRGAFIQSKRALLRLNSLRGEFSQGGAAALGAASFGATIAGGAILNKAKTTTGAGIGGALSGAGLGAGLGASFGPLGAAAGGLAGALVGAISSVKSFSKALEEDKTRDVINQFVERGGSARNVAGRLDEVTTNLRQPSLLDRGFGNQLGYFGNARVAFNALSPAVTRKQSIRDLTSKKIDAESNQIRQDFGPAAESLTAELQNNIIDRFKKGEKLDFNTLLSEVTQDQARTLAAGDVRFRSTDSVADQTAIGKSIAADAIRKQLEATKSAADLGAAIARLNRSTIELSTVFEAVDAKLRETDVFLGNFGTSVQRIMDPSNLVASQKFNVFSNVAGIPQSRVQGEVAAFEKQFGTGRTITGDSAILATQLKNELPRLLSSAQAQNPAADLQETLQKQFASANLLPAVRTNLNNSINALDTQTLGDIDPQKIADEIYSRFAPSLKNMEKGLESSVQNDAARLAVMNQRTGLQGNIVDRNLSINALRNQSVDTRRSILNQFPTTPAEAQGRVLRDLQTLGAPGSPAEILNAISQVQEGGVTAEEAPQFNNLIKALDLLRGDTRVLDATMEKQNQLQQAAQGSRSFLERALSGPDEIAKINEEGADLRTIMQGGQVSGPRALAALRLGEQLNSSLTEEQVRAQFGTTKAEFTNNLSRSLAQQGLANFAPDSRGIGSLMGQNLLPSRDLANQAGAAIDTQVQAEQALRELDQKRIDDLNAILQTNAAGFNEAIQNAFTSQPVQEFKDTVKVLANSELKLGGKVDLIVTFTNKEAITKDVQDAMKSAAIQVADERIALALNQHTAKANTA